MIEDTFESLNMVDKKSISDGFGGVIEGWVDGADFMGSIVLDNSTNGRIAEKQGVTNIYTIITKDNVKLVFNDVIKRKSDNQLFKIKSLNNLENRQPDTATMKVRVATAELFNIPVEEQGNE